MKALVTLGDGRFELKDVSLPNLKPTEILVKVVAIAQNPTDCKSLQRNKNLACTDTKLISGKTLLLNKRPGNILGCDFSGTVVEIGKEVPAGLRDVGERVAGCVHGGKSSLLDAIPI
jgi:NADPH:quinone reductase-like Zn-dependent oxidoreductase